MATSGDHELAVDSTGDWNGRKLELYIAVPSLPT